MKTIWLIPLLFVGAAFSQSLDCKTCDQDPDVKVTKLSKCEVDKLKAAETHLEEVKEQIFTDHGKLKDTVFQTIRGTYYCGAKVPYDYYELLDSEFVVKVTKYWEYTCNSGLVYTNVTTR